MTVPVVLITLQLLALCLLLLFLAVTDAIEARGPEIALAKLRGRGAVSTAMFGLSEPVLLLLLALPVGTLAGWGASALLSHVLLRPGTQVALPALGWVSAAVAAAGGLAAAVLAAQPDSAPPVLEEWRRSGLRLTAGAGWWTACWPPSRRRACSNCSCPARSVRPGPARSSSWSRACSGWRSRSSRPGCCRSPAGRPSPVPAGAEASGCSWPSGKWRAAPAGSGPRWCWSPP